MNQKNVIFANVYDWLRKENMIAGQKDLAKKTGITENTLTNILNGKTSVSDKTIHKLNEGFGFIFNPQYFRGQSIHLLMEDVAYYEQHPEEDISKPKQKEPDWMDAMLYRQTQQEKEMEELRRMLKATLERTW